MNNIYDVAVLGGGASGMMAAIQAAKKGASVILLEGNDCLGKKILATGNGRCNLTNNILTTKCYYGAKDAFVKKVFEEFSLEDTLAFFEEIGVAPVAMEDLYYPRSQQASAVATLLQVQLRQLNVEIMLQSRVRGVLKEEELFVVKHDKGEFSCSSVILATGGKASSIKGSNGDGYYYAKCFGHTITPLVPALVQLHTTQSNILSMAGARCNCKASIYVKDNFVREDFGELQLTEYGISGIVVFQLSRIAALALQENAAVKVIIDFMPEINEKELSQNLKNHLTMYDGAITIKEALMGMFNQKVLMGILKECKIDPEGLANTCQEKEIARMISVMKEFCVPITETHGFKNAQVTAGGIATEEINPSTMESKIVPGFFFAGEIVDVDGICGGYNLQWAWSSGAVAGRNAKKDKK